MQGAAVWSKDHQLLQHGTGEIWMDEEWDQPCGVHPGLQIGDIAVPPAMTDTVGQEDTIAPEKAKKEVPSLLFHSVEAPNLWVCGCKTTPYFIRPRRCRFPIK